jgi:formylglycine-generating enzyme required for sulfatase activity
MIFERQMNMNKIVKWIVACIVCAVVIVVMRLLISVHMNNETPSDMVWIPDETFSMGSPESDKFAEAVEKPAHLVKLDGFWMDKTEVTNKQFEKFVKATGYITEAEKDIDWDELKKQTPPGTPKPPDASLKAGAIVFTPSSKPGSADNSWWSWVVGANWKHPEGPESNLSGREQHPVVMVSWDDAAAYAKWAEKRLPTEAEWEFAARGGLKSARFTWGNDPFSVSKPQANIWEGEFPHANTIADGYIKTAPVKSYPPNGYGLYDMSGNALEWCSDWWKVDLYRSRKDKDSIVNPLGPSEYFDPRSPYEKQRVTRGGSFLSKDDSKAVYRPAFRNGHAFDTGISHIGFRCVK